MACSRCQKRREAIIRAAQAAKQRDLKTAASEARYVAKTAAQDVRNIVRPKDEIPRNK